MNFTNLIYLVLWLFCYYAILLFIPYMASFWQAGFLGGFWVTIPPETTWLIQILMYIVVPLVAIAYTITASKQEEGIFVGR